MSRSSRPTRSSLILLLIATLAVSLLVGLGRHVLTGPSPGVEASSQAWRSLLGSTTVFLVGGLPAAIITWLLVRRGTRKNTGWILASAAIGNGVSAILGLGVLRLIIWETTDWLLTLLILGGSGFFTFALVLLVAPVAGGSTAHTPSSADSDDSTSSA